MKKIFLILFIYIFSVVGVNASECLEYEKEVNVNNHFYCFSLSSVSDDLFHSNILSDYNISFSEKQIDIDVSNLKLENDCLLQLYLYDPNKKSFSSFLNTYTKDGLIFQVVHEMTESFDFSYEYTIYDDISCLDVTNNYDNCNVVSILKPTVNIIFDEGNKKENQDEKEIELFNDSDKKNSNIFLAIGGALLFLFGVVAVVMILVKKYY